MYVRSCTIGRYFLPAVHVLIHHGVISDIKMRTRREVDFLDFGLLQ